MTGGDVFALVCIGLFALGPRVFAVVFTSLFGRRRR